MQRYLFVSTISVYSDYSIVGLNESSPTGVMDDSDDETLSGRNYGPMKALCEKEAERAFPGRATIVRPGLIVGPGGRTDRFTYWPVRIDRGGEVLAPGNPTDPTQIVDVRDLTGWMIQMLEEGHTGTYNATGPQSPLSIGEMLYGIRAITASDVSFTWANSDFLAQQEVQPWRHMPVWVPSERESMRGFSRVAYSRAYDKGLTFRPLADTARHTLNWFKTLSEDRQSKLKSGLPPEREAEVLAAWHAQQVCPYPSYCNLCNRA